MPAWSQASSDLGCGRSIRRPSSEAINVRTEFLAGAGLAKIGVAAIRLLGVLIAVAVVLATIPRVRSAAFRLLFYLLDHWPGGDEPPGA